MLKSDHFFYACGLLSIVLFSVTFVTFSYKFLLKTNKSDNKSIVERNYIFDPDHNRNVSPICMFSNRFAYKIPYENSTCSNVTQYNWYLPWVRYELLAKIQKKNEEKKKRREIAKKKTVEEDQIKNEELDQSQPDHNNVSGNLEIPAQKEATQGDKLKQKPSEVLYTVLVALVTLSAVGACWEAFRNKFKRDQGGEGDRSGGGSGFKGSDKDCSLAEFTINRHLRRESQQQHQNHHQGNLHRQASFDVPAKVTQTLIHQSSLDRAFKSVKSVSEAINLEESRRNSMPLSPKDGKRFGRNSLSTLNVQPLLGTLKRQQSIDGTHEESSVFDSRKKPRFFIRRH